MKQCHYFHFSKHRPATTTLFANTEKIRLRNCMICKYFQQICKQHILPSGRGSKGKQTINSKTPYAGF